MANDAHIRATVKYNRETVDRIEVKPHKAEGAAIRAAAKASGQPLQRYVLDAVRERMERERIRAQDAQQSDAQAGDAEQPADAII